MTDAALSKRRLTWLFFLSGSAAIIYQIIWQRALYAAIGINLESVTVIVSVFMAGLGVGALAGGELSHRFSRRLPEVFFIFEVCIGLFGLVSLRLIAAVGDLVAGISTAALVPALYLLLGLPTLAMGATLPVLVAYLHQRDPSIGGAVSVLYFSNTLGSAAGALAVVTLLLVFLSLSGALVVAAGINFFVGGIVLASARTAARR